MEVLIWIIWPGEEKSIRNPRLHLWRGSCQAPCFWLIVGTACIVLTRFLTAYMLSKSTYLYLSVIHWLLLSLFSCPRHSPDSDKLSVSQFWKVLTKLTGVNLQSFASHVEFAPHDKESPIEHLREWFTRSSKTTWPIPINQTPFGSENQPQ